MAHGQSPSIEESMNDQCIAVVSIPGEKAPGHAGMRPIMIARQGMGIKADRDGDRA